MHSCARLGKRSGRFFVAAWLLASIGCSGSPTEPTSPAGTISTLTILYGASACQQLRAGRVLALNVYPPESPRANVNSASTWTSSDSSVLLLHPAPGAFIMVGPGTAEVRATYQGRTASMTITIQPDVYPRLDVSVINSFPGVEPRVRADLNPALARAVSDVTAETRFSSSDPGIASIDGSRITFKPRVGNVTISAAYNDATGSCGMSVYPTP